MTNLPGPRLVDRLADRIGLLTGLVDRLADRVGDFLGHRLPHRLAHRGANLAGPGLVHGLHDRVRDLLGDRLPHRLAHRVVDGPRAGLPHRLAHGVLDLLERLFRLVADAVDLFLLDDLLTDRLVAGVLLLLVNHVLDQPRAAARGPRRTTGFIGRLTTRTPFTGVREADRGHLRAAMPETGEPAIRGVGGVRRRHEACECQQAGKPRTFHVCRLCRDGLLQLGNGNETLGARRWPPISALSKHRPQSPRRLTTPRNRPAFSKAPPALQPLQTGRTAGISWCFPTGSLESGGVWPRVHRHGFP